MKISKSIGSKKILFFIVFLTMFSSLTYAGSNAVIVNANNSLIANSADGKNTIKRLYLKKMSSWPSGAKVNAIGRGLESLEYEAFIEKILGMSNADMAGHWMSLKQKTGETPPRSIKSAKIVIKLVGKKAGAFSFVSESDTINLPNNVKVLFKF